MTPRPCEWRVVEVDVGRVTLNCGQAEVTKLTGRSWIFTHEAEAVEFCKLQAVKTDRRHYVLYHRVTAFGGKPGPITVVEKPNEGWEE